MSTFDLIARYAAGPKLIRDAVAGMTPEQLRARPIAGKWSTLELVAHLADFDLIFVDRLTSVIAEDAPTLPGRDEQRYIARLAYDQRAFDDELQLIELCRRRVGRILAALQPSDWQRTGRHTEAGLMTLEQLLERGVKHVEHHVPFIHEKRRALGMGR